MVVLRGDSRRKNRGRWAGTADQDFKRGRNWGKVPEGRRKSSRRPFLCARKSRTRDGHSNFVPWSCLSVNRLKPLFYWRLSGEPRRTRTSNPLIKSQLLYH